MRGSAGNSTAALRCWHRQFVFDDLAIKTKIRINELALWQPDNEVFQSPALNIAKPLYASVKNLNSIH